jgi:hypothetical protein|tara:strand:+ start:3748 stop:4002 length:255 start_codon:yes stop_codon:yes gene_type:complete
MAREGCFRRVGVKINLLDLMLEYQRLGHLAARDEALGNEYIPKGRIKGLLRFEGMNQSGLIDQAGVNQYPAQGPIPPAYTRGFW